MSKMGLVTGCVSALVALLAAPGQAAITVQLSASAAPPTQYRTMPAGASLMVAFDTTYPASSPMTQTIGEAVIHLDRDFGFDTTGLGTCNAVSLAGTTTDQAKAACPNSQVGSGSAQLCSPSMGCAGTPGGGAIPVVVTAFNGVPSNGNPVLILHMKPGGLAASNAPVIAIGTILPSTAGGEYGPEIDFDFQDTSSTGLAFTHVDFTLDNLEPAAGHHYLSAHCSDPSWVFAGDFTFRAGGGKLSASTSQECFAVPDPNQASNTFAFGRVAHNQKKGTATLDVAVPNPGELTGSGNGASVAASTAPAVISKSVPAGLVQLLVSARGKKRQKLNETGKVKLSIAVSYAPTGGYPNTQALKLTLKKKQR